MLSYHILCFPIFTFAKHDLLMKTISILEKKIHVFIRLLSMQRLDSLRERTGDIALDIGKYLSPMLLFWIKELIYVMGL